MNDRIVELALEQLEKERTRIDQQIQEARDLLRRSRRRPGGKKAAPRKKPRSAASKRAQSQKMKAYWARRNKEAPGGQGKK